MFSFFCSMSLKVRVIQNTLSMQTCYEQNFFYSYFRSHFPVSVWVKNLFFSSMISYECSLIRVQLKLLTLVME